jgi:L-iditol 2-dehydrogenase
MTLQPEKPNRAAVLISPNHIEVLDWQEPVAGPTDVIIEVMAVGVCGSDVHYFKHGRIGDIVIDQPVVLGHEAAGTISAIGKDVKHLRVGDRVTLEPQRPCGHCEQCWSGAYNLCPDVIFMAAPPYHGAFARRVVNPADFTFHIPDSMSFEEAALMEPLAVGFWAAERAQIGAGKKCLIIGAGPIGLLAAQVAAARGASSIVISDVHPERINVVRKFSRFIAHDAGADPEYNLVEPVDHIIECSGSADVLNRALQRARPRGSVALVGINVDGRANIDVWSIMAKELMMVGVYRYAGIYPQAIALASSGQIDLKSIITHRFDLNHTADALSQSSRDMSSVKSIVLP